MTLREAIDQYIAWQRARGARFVSSAYALRRYSRRVGDAIGSDEVRSAQARAFLDDGATSASNRAFLHSALKGFYRYAIARGLATHSPLPPQPPQASPRSTPYNYSHDELRRLLDATKSYRKRVNQLEPYTFRGLLLLYGAGLRRGEALRKPVRHRSSSTGTARRWPPEPSATPSLDCGRRPAWSAATVHAINRACMTCATRSP